jgi:hypothetical protein
LFSQFIVSHRALPRRTANKFGYSSHFSLLKFYFVFRDEVLCSKERHADHVTTDQGTQEEARQLILQWTLAIPLISQYV